MDSVTLDPVEVLAHLRLIVGPNVNITGEQLQNFMEDLRNIMLKDLNEKNNEGTESSTMNCNCHCHAPKHSSNGEEDPNDGDDICTYVSNASNSTHIVKKPIKNDPVQNTKSYIRPWQITNPTATAPARSILSKNMKDDPVKLYHHYKDIWRQHRFPGEENHYGVRWNVRERMVGQDPQPRPTSRISSSR